MQPSLQAVWCTEHLGPRWDAVRQAREDGHLYGVQPHGLQPQQAVLPQAGVYPEVVHPASCTPPINTCQAPSVPVAFGSIPSQCVGWASGPSRTSAALAQSLAHVCGHASRRKTHMDHPCSCAVAAHRACHGTHALQSPSHACRQHRVLGLGVSTATGRFIQDESSTHAPEMSCTGCPSLTKRSCSIVKFPAVARPVRQQRAARAAARPTCILHGSHLPHVQLARDANKVHCCAHARVVPCGSMVWCLTISMPIPQKATDSSLSRTDVGADMTDERVHTRRGETCLCLMPKIWLYTYMMRCAATALPLPGAACLTQGRTLLLMDI